MHLKIFFRFTPITSAWIADPLVWLLDGAEYSFHDLMAHNAAYSHNINDKYQPYLLAIS